MFALSCLAGVAASSQSAGATSTGETTTGSETTTTTTSTTEDSGTSTDAGTSAEPAPDEGSDGSGTTAGTRPRLLLEAVKPRTVFFDGAPAKFRFKIAGKRTRDLVIKVVRKSTGKMVWRRLREGIEPRTRYVQRWRGKKKSGGFVRRGRFVFRVKERLGAKANRRDAKGKPRFRFFSHKFPVRGRHDYGDGIGAGRGHRGQDVFASCGTKIQAARGGRVQWKAYQGGGAGYYIVIDGRRTGRDYVYMHFRGPATVRKGQRVKTGQKVGYVGQSGNASGCHLHFELWSSPGWYEGGRYLNPTRKLKRWDRWS